MLLGDAGRDLTGKPASELVRSYFEVTFYKYISSEKFWVDVVFFS